MSDSEGSGPSARTAVADFKKGLLREAAKEVFSQRGIRDTSVRQIATAAGYTTSAIYTHYSSVEELYGDIVRESLETLLEELTSIREDAKDGHAVSHALRRFHLYYIDNPREFELSFHLYDGIRPHGLGEKLNGELNALMKSVFGEIGKAFIADGLADETTAMTRSTEACTFVFGLLLMYHTRRLFLLGADHERLLADYVRMVESTPSAPR
jgi:AcrR family transcriptional regulator